MLPAWTAGVAWPFLYIATSMVVPRNKRGRGYITRLLGKIIPPKSMWVPPAGASTRYLLAMIIFVPLELVGTLGGNLFLVTFWPIVIGLYIDDYINGGDDWKKRWESVKNKIKWKMDLPQPVPVRDTGA